MQSGDTAWAASAMKGSKVEERQLLLVTTVDVGGGLTDQIELRVGDNPEVRKSPFLFHNFNVYSTLSVVSFPCPGGVAEHRHLLSV